MAGTLGEMKLIKSLKAIPLLVVLMFTMLPISATATESRDYMADIITALSVGDVTKAQSLNADRNAKIDRLGLDNPKISIDDLWLVGKIMNLEAGNCPYDECAWGVGEVVLNRAASPEWDMPDTIEEVLKMPGQYYYPSLAGMFERGLPSERCLRLALRLLEGERHLEPDVIFHCNFPLGSSIHSSYKHAGHSRLYFGRSFNPRLYEGEAQ